MCSDHLLCVWVVLGFFSSQCFCLIAPFSFERSLLGNTSKQSKSWHLFINVIRNSVEVYFSSKCATTVFFLCNDIVAYCCITCGSLLCTRVLSIPNFTSFLYLNIFVHLALEECGCVLVSIYIHTYICICEEHIFVFLYVCCFFLFKIEYEWCSCKYV